MTIRTWRNKTSRGILEEGKAPKKFGSLDVDLAERRLEYLDAAESLGDLHELQALRLHKLKGTRKDQWAIRINGPWRVCFRFESGDAYDVEVTDYR